MVKFMPLFVIAGAIFLLDFSAALQCTGSDTVTFLITKKSRYQHTVDSIIRNSDFPSCRRRCASDSSCSAVVFWRSNRQCELHTAAVRSGNELLPQIDADYAEQMCLTPAATSVCTVSYERVPQGVLYGFAEEVLESVSLDECLSQCLGRAQCKSVMYFYAPRQCVLNSMSRAEQPQLFEVAKVDEFLVDYFETRCGGGATWQAWSPWSTCSNSLRVRGRRCSNDGACPGESVQRENCLTTTTTTTTASTRRPNYTRFPITSTRRPYVQGSHPCVSFRQRGYTTYADCLRQWRATTVKKRYQPTTTTVRRVYYRTTTPRPTTKRNPTTRGYVSRRCVHFQNLGYNTYDECLRNRKVHQGQG